VVGIGAPAWVVGEWEKCCFAGMGRLAYNKKDIMTFIFIFQLIVLIFSAVIHEVSHGYVAQALGDPTAEQAGRLTLNPLKHLDPFGSVILPLLLSLIPGGIIFGWAKPVPYNPNNLKDPKKGGALIAAAGPASNFLIAIAFSVFCALLPIATSMKRAISGMFVTGDLTSATPLLSNPVSMLYFLFLIVVLINIVLGVFNLVPIPPLDGSKVLFGFLPVDLHRFEAFFGQFGFVILILFIFFGWGVIAPIINVLFHVLVGG